MSSVGLNSFPFCCINTLYATSNVVVYKNLSISLLRVSLSVVSIIKLESNGK